MSHLKRIIKIFVNIFTWLLLLLLALVIYGKLVVTFGDNTYPNYFGYTFFEVASGSMKPTLKINDVIVVKIGRDNLKKGDIIAFQGEDAIITHRILFIEGNIITVKGDNNSVVDKPIVVEQVIGKIVKVFPKMGIWKKVIVEPKILFGIFITLLLFDFALSYNGKQVLKEKKKSNKKEEVAEKPIATQIVDSEKAPKTTREKVVEAEKLLELTRKIDIDEINKLLEGTEFKLEKKEINNIKREINKTINNKDKKDTRVNLSEKEKKIIEYTMRLDLNEIQKKINSKVK